MILAGPKNQVHQHSEILGAPVFIRPALRLDEVDPMEESRARIVERIESGARKFHAWFWGPDAHSKSNVAIVGVIACIVVMVVVAVLR